MRQRVFFLLPIILLSVAACTEAPIAGPGARRVEPSTARLDATGTQACVPDAKLIGRIELSTRDEPGTWWHLTRTGFDAAGVTDYLSEISTAFGIPFPDLDAAVAYLVAQVVPLDTNENGFVCAYRGRGVRAWTGDPYFHEYYFPVKDDKHVAP